MSDLPAVSVVVAARDAAATIRRPLASLARQRHRDWEALVVDDGSRDETAAIVAGWAREDRRVRLITQAGVGAAAARNCGLVEARGKWTLFLDADDSIAPDHLARLLGRLRRDPWADAGCCGHVRRTVDGRVILRHAAPRLDRDPLAIVERRPPAAIHAIVARTTALRAIGGFDTSLRTNEDWDLWLRLARAGGRFVVEPRALASYWSSPSSLTRDHAAMLRDTLTMLERVGGVDGGRMLEALLWNGGIAIGEGRDAARLLDLIPAFKPPRALEGAEAALTEGLAIGTGRPIGGLAAHWNAIAQGVRTFLAALDQHAPGLGAALARGIEWEVLRAGRFRGPLTVGDTHGLTIAARHLWAGVERHGEHRRLLLKVPLLRPRSRWMIECAADETISPARLRRLLLNRLVGQPDQA